MEYIEHYNEFIFELPNFVSDDRCDLWIADIEGEGFEQALINGVNGATRRPDIRNNDRLIRDDPATASAIWKKLHPFVSQSFCNRHVVGLNEKFRFYRYGVGQKFDWHRDGYFERDNGERSLFTFMIYLSDDFDGGGTSFADNGFSGSFPDFCVTPKKGSALLFYHPIAHRGDPVVAGRKYVLRSDVMYSAEVH
jgi:hypothetical protein